LRDGEIKIELEVYGIRSKAAEERAKKEAMKNNVEGQIHWHGSLSESDFDEKMQESTLTLAAHTQPV
jgi:hypothetical protein